MDSGSVKEKSREVELIDGVNDSHIEEALRSSEENYHTLFDSIDQGYVVLEILFEDGVPSDTRFIEANRSFREANRLNELSGEERQ